jgi:hypothetical protein
VVDWTIGEFHWGSSFATKIPLGKFLGFPIPPGGREENARKKRLESVCGPAQNFFGPIDTIGNVFSAIAAAKLPDCDSPKTHAFNFAKIEPAGVSL